MHVTSRFNFNRCVDVNDSGSLRELIASLMLGEETLAVSGKPEVIDLANRLDRSSLKKLMGIALIDVSLDELRNVN